MASLVLTDSSQLTSDSQHLVISRTVRLFEAVPQKRVCLKTGGPRPIPVIKPSEMCQWRGNLVLGEWGRGVTYPMDLIKTRLQIQGELTAVQEGVSSSNLYPAPPPPPSSLRFLLVNVVQAPHRGMVQTAAGVIKEEGFFKLWHGLTPAIYRNIVYSGTRIVIYQKVREYVLKPDPSGNYSIWKSALNGMFSGVVAQFLANPADLVKIQMQMEGKRRLMGKPPRIASPLKAFQSIYGKAGIAGLWKGAVPNMQRAALVNLGDLAAYDSSKRFLLSKTGLQDNYITHIIASICAGFVAAITGTPADVVKARVMNQPVDDKGR
uniref:Mitochondrial uncoupling protein 4 n=1 Tax=Timema shepardi TaxID=629360 RepID=A0A7R9G560_TIMSH|nr:unnamed protein product [Timema shepardi]